MHIYLYMYAIFDAYFASTKMVHIAMIGCCSLPLLPTSSSYSSLLPHSLPSCSTLSLLTPLLSLARVHGCCVCVFVPAALPPTLAASHVCV
uniref:Uncharacterized protein n=1 Tax=Arundo donax TaxID=35708 RepID=A0A0A9DSR2_ARUDO